MALYWVTGAAGFIGHRVSQLLCDAGHSVVGLDNLNDSYDPCIKDWRLGQLRACEGFKFARQDICDFAGVEALAQAHGRPEAIIHLAARAGVRQSVIDPWIYLETNSGGTLNLLELCQRQGVKKFIMASTSSIYGANPPLPTPEEADSSHPLQSYAASKKGAEAMCHVYHHLYGLDATILRFFTVYGPAGRPDMVMFRFVQWIAEGRPVKITGDGEQMRGFTYVDDIARGVFSALKPVGYEIINLGGHECISINDLLHKIEERLGKRAVVEYIERNPADVDQNWADVSKARRLLGWEPQVTLDEGISRLVDWYQRERAWASQIKTT